jgi:outer membrane protein OmpA-like peptidoglycan-associated protein
MNRALIASVALVAAALSGCTDNPNGFSGDKTAAAPPAYTVTRHANNTEYAIPEQLLFATDSADVLPTGHIIIAQLSALAQKHSGAAVEVNGYTDTTGTKQHNQKLSVARADAVAGEMAQNGVAPDRIKAQGFGETDLLVPTDDHVNEAKNRRVVVVLASR